MHFSKTADTGMSGKEASQAIIVNMLLKEMTHPELVSFLVVLGELVFVDSKEFDDLVEVVFDLVLSPRHDGVDFLFDLGTFFEALCLDLIELLSELLAREVTQSSLDLCPLSCFCILNVSDSQHLQYGAEGEKLELWLFQQLGDKDHFGPCFETIIVSNHICVVDNTDEFRFQFLFHVRHFLLPQVNWGCWVKAVG